jgi:hypothetical protein
MLSFVLSRALLRSAIFPTTQRLPMRAVLSKQCLALSARKNFGTTTTNDRDSESTTASESGPEPEPEPKSKRKSSKKGKEEKATKRRAKKKVETKKSMPCSVTFDSRACIQCSRPLTLVVIRPEHKPPKPPGSPFTLWFSDWCREQPKIESLETAQGTVKKAAQIWHTVSEYEKQVCIQFYPGARVF